MWRVGVDSGGTFTDICLVDESTGTPDDPSHATVAGVVEGLRETTVDPITVEIIGDALCDRREAED